MEAGGGQHSGWLTFCRCIMFRRSPNGDSSGLSKASRASVRSISVRHSRLSSPCSASCVWANSSAASVSLWRISSIKCCCCSQRHLGSDPGMLATDTQMGSDPEGHQPRTSSWAQTLRDSGPTYTARLRACRMLALHTQPGSGPGTWASCMQPGSHPTSPHTQTDSGPSTTQRLRVSLSSCIGNFKARNHF